MKTKRFSLCAGAALLGLYCLSAQAVDINLFEYSLNVDGAFSTTVYEYATLDPAPAGVDDSLFDYVTGLGDITVTVGGTGSHNIDFLLDIEIDNATNFKYNEFGSVTGSAASGQSWEIDEPGYFFGDIYDNVLDSTLDNSNALPEGSGIFSSDVSMALGWDFSLSDGETAIISLSISDVLADLVTQDFYLSQTDPLSDLTLYMASTLEIRGSGTQVPEPATLFLIGAGLAGLLVRRRVEKA